MEPLLPTDPDGLLEELSLQVLKRSAALFGTVHPRSRGCIAELLRTMNSYYSNLIEGHHTHPIDIERALNKDFSAEPAKRTLQIESAAHIEVQREMEQRLAAEPNLKICSQEFLCWLHREFYTRLAEDMRIIKGERGETRVLIPGEIRVDQVKIGSHVAPAASALPAFLARFAERYAPERLRPAERLIAAAAAHHRLAWIHPFLDGNGRVIRLFSKAFLIGIGVDGHGLWAVSRGLARDRDAYLAALISADSDRRGDLDGRGNLSAKGLALFCEYYLRTMLDQIEFMASLLEVDVIERRINAYVKRAAIDGELPTEAGAVIGAAYLRGEISRGDASRLAGKSERYGNALVAKLLHAGLLRSESPKGVLLFHVPIRAVGYYFPRLYPAGVEEAVSG